MKYLPLIQQVVMFLLQLIICEVGLVSHFPRKKHFIAKFIGAFLGFIALVGMDILVWKNLPNYGSFLIRRMNMALFFAGIVFSNALALTWSFDCNYSDALFAVIAGYSIEHAASRFSYILKACIFAGAPVPPVVEYLGFEILMPLLFSVLSYVVLIRKSIAAKRMRYGDKKVIAISAINLFICIALSPFEPEVGSGSEKEILQACASYISAILGCGLCLCLQVGLFQKSDLEEKNHILEEMLEIERKKQSLSKETIEIINRKCHDLRHQIHMLEMQTPEARHKSLESISDAILIYDSIVKTGNASLDLVLMEKKLFCEKYNIQFSYLVDGEKFAFMDEADIYAMIGNMLENAIESEMKEAEQDKRIITFVAHARGEMLYIRMENYCSGTVTFKDSFPETDKSDKAFHGYGTRSIAHIAESYGGSARFSQENQYFTVEVLLPTKIHAKNA